MSKLFIHIGTHKTGSTAIQKALKNSFIELKNNGVLYIPLFPSLLELYSAESLDEKLIDNARHQLKSYITKQSKNNTIDRFIISWEGFSGNAFEGYKNTGVIAESLRNITSDFEVKIIVYLRRQDDFIESLYTQLIHQGGSYSFKEFCQKFDDSAFNWGLLLQRYAEYFGESNIIVRRYDKEYLPEKDSLLIEFSNIIGSKKLSVGTGNKTPNAGYSRNALEIARLTNPYLDDDGKNRLRRILQQVDTKKSFEKYAYFNNDDRSAFLLKYADSNNEVKKKYFEEYDGMLFSGLTADNELKEYQGLSVEDATLILTKAIIHTQQNNSLLDSHIIRGIVGIENYLISILKKSPKVLFLFRKLFRKM